MFTFNGKVLKDVGFTIGDTNYPPFWLALSTAEDRAAIGIVEVDNHVRPDARLGSVIQNDDGSYTLEPYAIDQVITAACQSIDDKVAAVYTLWTRFQVEYDARKAAAQAFKDANYQGDPGVYITAYATAANITNQAAADSVLEQAVMFATALDNLAAARMRKFEVKRLDDAQAVLTLTDSINASVDSIASQIS